MTGSERAGAIVVGAGGGRRLGGVEKAFLPLLGRPLLCYAVDTFERAPEIDEVCLVLAAGSVPRGRDLVQASGWRKVVAVVAGGTERQDSVRAGLAALSGCEWVLVHDAARPLVTPRTIREGLDAARDTGAAIAASPVRDTLKRGQGNGDVVHVGATVDRAGLWAAQTPQVFRTSVLRAAFAAAGERAAAFTDDASLVEAIGGQVRLFAGGVANLKITHPEDVEIAEALLAHRLRHSQ